MVLGLLGSKAPARDKSEWGRSLVMIGWHVNLDAMTVSLSDRNMNKSIYSFFCFDVNGGVSLDQLERMASYASRASMLCLPMRSYVTQLHKAKTAYQGNHAAVRELPALAKCDVQIWRAFLCLLKLDPKNYARSLESFRPRRPTVLLEYDASLEGFGVGVSLWSERLERFELAAYTRLDVPYATDMDSSKQNTNEYITVVLGLLLCKRLAHAPTDFAYNLIGDSMASLSWCRKGFVSSSLARRANIGWTMVNVDMNATVAVTQHIPGTYNVIYDGLSRGQTGRDVGLPPELYIPVEPDSPIAQYITLCNPALPLSSPSDHSALSIAFMDLLSGSGF